jgi:hypothetical protein
MADEPPGGGNLFVASTSIRDGLAASDPSIPTVYGPKFHVAVTDRDVRIAFGTMHTASGQDGKLVSIPAYRIAVFIPFETLFEIKEVLVKLCEKMEQDSAPDVVERTGDGG